MNLDSLIRARVHTFMAFRAFLLIEHNVPIPGQSVLGAGHYAQLLFTGYTDMDTNNFRPVILNHDPGLLDTLQTLLMSLGTGQHAESAIGAVAFFELKHCEFSWSGFLW